MTEHLSSACSSSLKNRSGAYISGFVKYRLERYAAYCVTPMVVPGGMNVSVIMAQFHGVTYGGANNTGGYILNV
jgi:hypothetical protein